MIQEHIFEAKAINSLDLSDNGGMSPCYTLISNVTRVYKHEKSKNDADTEMTHAGLESDMVTVILAIGRSHSIRHLALGRNFAMKSR